MHFIIFILLQVQNIQKCIYVLYTNSKHSKIYLYTLQYIFSLLIHIFDMDLFLLLLKVEYFLHFSSVLDILLLYDICFHEML